VEISVDVQGLAEIERKLKLLSQKGVRNSMRRALRKGANVIRDAARSNARRFDDPETRAAIWENVVVNTGGVRRERRAGGPMVRVGVIGGAKTGSRVKYTNSKKNQKAGIAGQEYSVAHWRFLEFGTSEMPAQPFLRPAASSRAEAAYQAIALAAPAELDKELRKEGIIT
jgi:HK97 gp10 family phage protein